MKRSVLAVCSIALLLVAFCPEDPPPPTQPTCPEGYVTVEESVWVPGECTCPTVTWPMHFYWSHWTLHTFGPITFTYDKAEDPTKCHRPTASSLGVPSALQSEFNHDFDEWVDASCASGSWTEPVCELAPVLCEDEAALNYGEEGECVYPEPTPPPVCEPMLLGVWYQCVSGASTWSAQSATRCWCGGLTGLRHYHVSYDCGQSYVEEGNWPDAPGSLGHYPGSACGMNGWAACR